MPLAQRAFYMAQSITKGLVDDYSLLKNHTVIIMSFFTI